MCSLFLCSNAKLASKVILWQTAKFSCKAGYISINESERTSKVSIVFEKKRRDGIRSLRSSWCGKQDLNLHDLLITRT